MQLKKGAVTVVLYRLSWKEIDRPRQTADGAWEAQCLHFWGR